MNTVQTYFSKSFITIIATKKQNPEMAKDILRNYPSTKNLDEATNEFLKLTGFASLGNPDCPPEIDFRTYTAKEVKAKDTKSLLSFQAKTTNAAGLELAEEILTTRGAEFTSRLQEFLPKEQKKASRKLLKEYTDEELQLLLNIAKERKGAVVTFTSKKYGAKLLTGTIKGARLDKRSGFIQYRIEVEHEDGAKEILGCAHNSKSLTEIESPYHNDEE